MIILTEYIFSFCQHPESSMIQVILTSISRVIRLVKSLSLSLSLSLSRLTSLYWLNSSRWSNYHYYTLNVSQKIRHVLRAIRKNLLIKNRSVDFCLILIVYCPLLIVTLRHLYVPNMINLKLLIIPIDLSLKVNCTWCLLLQFTSSFLNVNHPKAIHLNQGCGFQEIIDFNK